MQNHNHKNRGCSGRRLAIIAETIQARLGGGVLHSDIIDIAQRSARAAFIKGISDAEWLAVAWRIFTEDALINEGAIQLLTLPKTVSRRSRLERLRF